jgi:heptosyltransferase-3
MTLSSEQTLQPGIWSPGQGTAAGNALRTGEDNEVAPAQQANDSMPAPLVDRALLERSDKILFISHLALGDYTYLQGCFEEFARAFPHLKIHLWVDERRRTSRPAAWPHLKKYALYDWLAECPYFDKVYDETYSPALYKQSLQEAQAEAYPIVVSLAVLDRHKYAILARKISPDGFVVGQKKRVRAYDLAKRLIYRKLDACIPAYSDETHPDQHISDIFADWFMQVFNLYVPPAARYPVLTIPDQWMDYARDQFAAWDFSANASANASADTARPSRVVFLNSYSKSIERSWPLPRVIELIRTMRQHDDWRDAGFIVNVVPEALPHARALFAEQGLARTHLFSAEDNFFQLPAVLSLCQLIISVETAVMHLANAVHVPVIALMRQKNPEWVPIDKRNSTVVTVPRAEDWVDKIGVDDVMAPLAAQAT